MARVYGRVFPFPGVTLKMVFYNLRADSDDQSDNNTCFDDYYDNAFDDNIVNNDKTVPVVRVRVESNHIVVAVNGQVRLPLANNAHDTVDDKC